MADEPVVEILLATYNGAEFLPAQLESILKQTYSNWRILARDDGSTDGTSNILKAFARANRGRLQLIEDRDKGLGARGNFARLLEHSMAPYVMFCDQDDIWLPNKIELTLTRMQALEALLGKEASILIHTDLKVVNRDLQEINASLWRYQGYYPEAGQSWNRLLIQNVITGCTMMLNRSLTMASLPIPREAIMHDWWIALVASLRGYIIAIPEATILYRQHGKNDIGAKRWGWRYLSKKLLTVWDREPLLQHLSKACKQAEQLHRYYHLLDSERQDVITAFVTLREMSFLRRRVFLLRHKILKLGLIRNIGLLLRV